jgi:indolepyruvate ferredoxin oxidoreductase, beta subunit
MLELKKDPTNIIITGVGGQGNVLASQILGGMLIKKGYRITIGETYGASQRGGSVMSHLRISRSQQFSPLIPEGQCDVVLGLEPIEALRVMGKYGNPGVLTIMNTRPIYPMDVIAGNVNYPELTIVLGEIKNLSLKVWTLNATEIALEMGNPLFSNIVMLGALSALELLPLDRETFQTVIKEILPKDSIEANLTAHDRGREVIRQLLQ